MRKEITRLLPQYLDPHTFLWWLRSLLSDDPRMLPAAIGTRNRHHRPRRSSTTRGALDIGLMPTVEEILRSWARDSSAFVSADEKVKTYLNELERRADETGAMADVELLKTFRQTWETLASELR